MSDSHLGFSRIRRLLHTCSLVASWDGLSSTMKTTQLPLKALEQRMYWAVFYGDTSRLGHHSDHGVQYISSVYHSV